MRKLIILAAVAALALVIAAPGASAHNDPKDCSDFPTQKAAQKWFRHHHPRADPAGLDADHDGIACEDNARVLMLQAAPPNVVGLKLPVASERLRAAGWIPRPFNTDTLFGIVVPSHYTVCHQYRPIGKKVRLLAQKYGC
jgi:Excalibur calcium-binding domain